jgi:hypothetical protein
MNKKGGIPARVLWITLKEIMNRLIQTIDMTAQPVGIQCKWYGAWQREVRNIVWNVSQVPLHHSLL